MAVYLITAFRDRERVKTLGARWDADARRWYVPDGRDLAPFARWLPAETGVALVAEEPSVELDVQEDRVAPVPSRGIPLSVLLRGVGDIVDAAFRTGIWTVVEVAKVDLRGSGHVYLEVAERDVDGTALAQARAMIWARTASAVIPAFERATGAVLAAGIKLLVRARPTVHPVYGLSLDVDAIDPDYTLGDLEAKKKEIRRRLQSEGLFDRNRRLPAPWDYNAVLVVAPQGAAGLGDFRAESERLERFGVCCFTYAHSRFQGEGAAAEIRDTLVRAMGAWTASGRPPPDAVCIIRGGGAVNDLAWLDDYDLARWICECDVPVITGIGHERDETLLDEVARLPYDTPSKAIAGIETVIRQRCGEARTAFEAIAGAAAQTTNSARRAVTSAWSAASTQARADLHRAREASAALWSGLRVAAHKAVGGATASATQLHHDVCRLATSRVEQARQSLPQRMGEIRSGANEQILLASERARRQRDVVLERAAVGAQRARLQTRQAIAGIGSEARRHVADARTRSEAVLREIAGQGPEKSLKRGFAILRSNGEPLTSAGQLASAPADADVDVEFHDGHATVRKPGSTP